MGSDRREREGIDALVFRPNRRPLDNFLEDVAGDHRVLWKFATDVDGLANQTGQREADIPELGGDIANSTEWHQGLEDLEDLGLARTRFAVQQDRPLIAGAHAEHR